MSEIPKVPAALPSELKERYDFTCPSCGQSHQAAPSIMMHDWGMNTGSANCPNCKAFLHLSIDEKNEQMVAELFADHYARRKAGG